MEISERILKLNEENVHLLNMLSSNFEMLENNFTQLLYCLEEQNHESHGKIQELQTEILKLNDNIKFTLDPFWQEIKNKMFDFKTELKKRDQIIEDYKTQSHLQTEEYKKLQIELKSLQNNFLNQNAFITSFVSTLSSLLWKVSKEPQIILNLITWNKFAVFFDTVTKVLQKYFESYVDQLPHHLQPDEAQFITASIGIITNIAAVQEGRHFLISNNEGREALTAILKNVTKIPSSNISIQRMMLMALFNASIHDEGMKMIENEQSLIRLLIHNITNHQNELKYISIKFLQSITYNIKSEKLILSILDLIPLQKLKELEYNNPSNVTKMIKNIREHIQLAMKRFHKL